SDLTTFIKRSELARDRGEQRPERFSVGQKVDARVTQFDRRTHKVQVSIKALEVAEEKEAIAQYGSTDSGATIGDILGTALKRGTEKPAEKKEWARDASLHESRGDEPCRSMPIRSSIAAACGASSPSGASARSSSPSAR